MSLSIVGLAMYYLYTQSGKVSRGITDCSLWAQKVNGEKESEWRMHNLSADPVKATYLMSLDRNSELIQPFWFDFIFPSPPPWFMWKKFFLFFFFFKNIASGERTVRVKVITLPRSKKRLVGLTQLKSSQNQNNGPPSEIGFPSILYKTGDKKWITQLCVWKECSHLYFTTRAVSGRSYIIEKHHFYSIHSNCNKAAWWRKGCSRKYHGNGRFLENQNRQLILNTSQLLMGFILVKFLRRTSWCFSVAEEISSQASEKERRLVTLARRIGVLNL